MISKNKQYIGSRLNSLTKLRYAKLSKKYQRKIQLDAEFRKAQMRDRCYFLLSMYALQDCFSHSSSNTFADVTNTTCK